MKRIKLLIIVFVCLFVFNVKADMGAPSVVIHKVMVTNKNGAQCYSGGKKTSQVIPYGTTFDLMNEINGSYVDVYVNDGEYSCNIKYSDISAVNQSFNLKDAEKLDSPRKAVILAKGGLNMRKGPAVTYGKITTIPQYAVVTATYSAGEYWYYVTYNGSSGWVTGMDNYLGFDGKEVLVYYEPLKIYSENGKTVLGTIPANTEITNYINLSAERRTQFAHYVSYNNIRGYVEKMFYKTDGAGKIKLTSNYILEMDDNGKTTKSLNSGQEFEYTMYNNWYWDTFYIPSKKISLEFAYDTTYEYVKEAKVLTKTKGYIGEGLFGEAKTKKDDEPIAIEENEEQEEIPVIPEEEKTMSIKDIIIIGLLAGIFLALTALVIIKLVNSKKKTVSKPKEEPIKREEINVPDKEIAKAREELIKEMNRGKHEESTPVKKEDNKEE